MHHQNDIQHLQDTINVLMDTVTVLVNKVDELQGAVARKSVSDDYDIKGLAKRILQEIIDPEDQKPKPLTRQQKIEKEKERMKIQFNLDLIKNYGKRTAARS